jgi:hypothetical protein
MRAQSLQWKAFLATGLAVGIAGCAGVPQGIGGTRAAGPPTAADKRYEESTNWLSHTEVQAAVLGGVGSTAACLAAGQKPLTCLLAGAIGTGVGYGVGSALNANREAHAQQEMTIDQAISVIKNDNANAAKMVVAQRGVVEEKDAELRRIRSAIKNKSMSVTDAQRNLNAVENTQKNLEDKTKALKQREQDWTARNEKLHNPEMSQQISELRRKIRKADATIEAMRENVEETRKVIAAG